MPSSNRAAWRRFGLLRITCTRLDSTPDNNDSCIENRANPWTRQQTRATRSVGLTCRYEGMADSAIADSALVPMCEPTGKTIEPAPNACQRANGGYLRLQPKFHTFGNFSGIGERRRVSPSRPRTLGNGASGALHKLSSPCDPSLTNFAALAVWAEEITEVFDVRWKECEPSCISPAHAWQRRTPPFHEESAVYPSSSPKRSRLPSGSLTEHSLMPQGRSDGSSRSRMACSRSPFAKPSTPRKWK